MKSIADEFIASENYAAVLTIYEVLVTEAIEHFNDYRDEYIAFSFPAAKVLHISISAGKG